jgi:hypothetical protein
MKGFELLNQPFHCFLFLLQLRVKLLDDGVILYSAADGGKIFIAESGGIVDSVSNPHLWFKFFSGVFLLGLNNLLRRISGGLEE